MRASAKCSGVRDKAAVWACSFDVAFTLTRTGGMYIATSQAEVSAVTMRLAHALAFVTISAIRSDPISVTLGVNTLSIFGLQLFVF